jgi:hypothetical protein
MNSVSNFVREIMSKKTKKEEETVQAEPEVGLSPEGKPLDEVADIVLTHPEEAPVVLEEEQVVADELPPVEETASVEASLPPCGSEFCSEGVCQNASAFVSKFFSHKYEIVNLKDKQISLLSCALQIDYQGGETHIDKVERIVEALGIKE